MRKRNPRLTRTVLALALAVSLGATGFGAHAAEVTKKTADVATLGECEDDPNTEENECPPEEPVDTTLVLGTDAAAVGTEATALGTTAYAEGDHSTAVGGSSFAYGVGTTAVGSGATAFGDEATALGFNASAGVYATALGTDAQAGEGGTSVGRNSYTGLLAVAVGTDAFAEWAGTALGYATLATGIGSTALGYQSWGLGEVSTAVGAFAQADSLGSNAFGYGSWANGNFSTAIGGAIASGGGALSMGHSAEAYGLGAIAIGTYYTCEDFCTILTPLATGANAMAIGSGAWASMDNVVAIGPRSTVVAVNGTALGHDAWVYYEADRSVAVGYNSWALRADAVSFGNEWEGYYRQLTNIADGTEAHDAVTLGQLDGLRLEFFSFADTAVTYTDDTRSVIRVGAKDGSTGALVTNLTAGTLAAGSTDAVTGDQLFTTNETVTLLDGRVGVVEGEVTFIDGRVSTLETLVGGIGGGNLLNVIAYDDDTHGLLSLGGANGTVITNVGDAVNDTDAVNKRTLDAALAGVGTGDLTAVADALGGGATWAGGVFTGPSYMIQGHSVGTVGDALGWVDNYITNLDARLALVEGNAGGGSDIPTGTGDGIAIGDSSHAENGNSVAIGEGSTATGDNSVAIGSGSTANEDNTVSVGSEGHERRITNVADGEHDTDAANVRQVNKAKTDAIAASKTYTDTKFNALSQQFDSFKDDVWDRLDQQDERIDANGAMSSAQMSMSINAAAAMTERGAFAVGMGSQNSQQAISVGFAKRIGRATFSIGGAFSDTDESIGVGFGLGL